MSVPTKLLIADRDGTVSAQLAAVLRGADDLAVVAEASNCFEAVEQALHLRPDVVLIDATILSRDGFEAISRIKRCLPDVRIIVLADSGREEGVFQALKCGATGYALRSDANEKILQTVRQPAIGWPSVSSDVVSRLNVTLHRTASEPRLSQREEEVLDLLEEGLTNKEIADRLVVSESTVRTYVYRLLEKLHLERRHEAVAYAMRRRLRRDQTSEESKAVDARPEAFSRDLPQIPTRIDESYGTVAPPAVGHAAEGTAIPLDGERKQATALLVRVDCSSLTSEEVDSTVLEDMLPECLDLIGREIGQFQGTVVWPSSEGLVSFFGVPVSTEHAPEQALSAALAILGCLHDRTDELIRRGVRIDLRIGVNSGPVQVEKSEDSLGIKYVAIGDTTRLASVVRDMAKPGTIVATQSTYESTKRHFDFKPRGKAYITGRARPIRTYRLQGVKVVQGKPSQAFTRGLASFVGRERETDALSSAFAKASSGFGQVVGIVGEAGVGKSRLILEFRESLSGRSFTWLEGSCRHYGSHVPYLPLLEVLRSYFEIRRDEPGLVAAERVKAKMQQVYPGGLETLLPPLGDVLSLGVDLGDYPRLEPKQRRDRVFDAMKDLLLHESDSVPLALVIEDLQWIDRTSEEFLTYLMSSLDNAHFLLVLLYRPEYTHGWGSRSIYSQIRMDELTPSDSVRLIQSILSDGEVTPGLYNYITERARGNPLFIEEFITTLQEEGAISKTGGRYLLRIEPYAGKIPHSIQGIIQARIDRLRNDLKRAMQVASVIGVEFSYGTLQSATGMGRELKANLLDLQQAEFIFEKRVSPEPEYVFKHNLIREISYSSLVAKKRWEFHEKVGHALEETYRDRLDTCYDVLAHHYSRSRNAEKAYHYLELSALKASSNYSNWEAFRLGKEAIDTLNALPVSDDNSRRGIEARIRLEGTMRLLGYPEDSWEILEEGARLAGEIGDGRSLAAFYSSMGLCCTFRGEPTRGIEYSNMCISEAEKAEDTTVLAPIAFDLCSAYAFTGEHLKTLELAPRVTALLEKNHQEYDSFGGPYGFNVYCALSAWHGHALAHLGDFKACKAVLDKATRIAKETGNLHTMAFTELMYGLSMDIKGDGEVAVSHVREALRCGEEGQIIPVMVMGHMSLGWAHWCLGDTKTALKHMKKSFDLRKDSGFVGQLSLSYYTLAMIQYDSGDLESARSSTEQSLSAAEQSREMWTKGAARLLLGRILGKQDVSKAAAAEGDILSGMATLEGLRIRPLQAQGHLMLGELWADMGRKKKALQNLNGAAAAFKEMDMTYWLRRTQQVLRTHPKLRP
jgi:DNA-binding NarL/FixJ family response regulator/class 3 adenylate cyclase/tetratricopeptide (TPR) repeat protein